MNNTLKRHRISSYTLMRDTQHRRGLFDFEATTVKLRKELFEATSRPLEL